MCTFSLYILRSIGKKMFAIFFQNRFIVVASIAYVFIYKCMPWSDLT